VQPVGGNKKTAALLEGRAAAAADSSPVDLIPYGCCSLFF
jgi:hypothetical protein